MGWRELHLTGKELRKLLAKLEKAPAGANPELEAELDELINWANIANDECDFGASLQLGLDLLNHGRRFARQAASVLANAYTLLDRPAFATIARQHGAQRAAD